ncbi:MAG: hypothetical protein HAW67_04780 [Endozoicomonadaceae bacterium]|nr:hypothetical protein [Endozoicomonadaceae bacterium]
MMHPSLDPKLKSQLEKVSPTDDTMLQQILSDIQDDGYLLKQFLFYIRPFQHKKLLVSVLDKLFENNFVQNSFILDIAAWSSEISAVDIIFIAKKYCLLDIVVTGEGNTYDIPAQAIHYQNLPLLMEYVTQGGELHRAYNYRSYRNITLLDIANIKQCHSSILFLEQHNLRASVLPLLTPNSIKHLHYFPQLLNCDTFYRRFWSVLLNNLQMQPIQQLTMIDHKISLFPSIYAPLFIIKSLCSAAEYSPISIIGDEARQSIILLRNMLNQPCTSKLLHGIVQVDENCSINFNCTNPIGLASVIRLLKLQNIGSARPMFNGYLLVTLKEFFESPLSTTNKEVILELSRNPVFLPITKEFSYESSFCIYEFCCKYSAETAKFAQQHFKIFKSSRAKIEVQNVGISTEEKEFILKTV